MTVRKLSIVLFAALSLSPALARGDDAAIGAPPAAGSHSWADKTLTITGTGAGLNVKGADQAQFTYFPRAAGDFEVVARLATLSEGNATAGIMARNDNSPTGMMTALSFNGKDSTLNWHSRVSGLAPTALARVPSSGIKLAQPPPLWMKMVRLGNDFGVYKSRDGKLWTMISNVSGGPTALTGKLEVGFYVAGGDADKPASATFDNINIGAPHLAFRSSWVGNTFGCRDDDAHVSNALSAMWVAPDGTCYASSYWDEGGRPVTSYRNGKVARSLPIGTPETAEGGITGDDKHIYVATVDRITELDPAAADFAPRPIVLSVNLQHQNPNHSVVSGMASNGSELFVSDSRDNLVRVISLAPVKTYQTAVAANDGIATAPAPVAVPANDPRYAPALVYQTQRVGEGFRYTLPGFTPGAEYTVRGHFAEYKLRPADHRKVQFGNKQLNIYELAGGAANSAGDPDKPADDQKPADMKPFDAKTGLLKAAVMDFPGYKADAAGNVVVFFSGGYGGGLCGLEVLDAAGKRVIAINCGGPTVGDFIGESPEQTARNFAFERPGPMTIDKRGDLWIIQRGDDFPGNALPTPKYKAAIKCYHPNGTFTNREIDDVVNPRALGYDAQKDQLIVGESGPDLNVRFYGSLTTKPALARTFGEKGGIYSGKHPGWVEDPAAGDFARFAGINGVGVDAQGNLYVGGGYQGTDLRMFTPTGKLGWKLNSLMFCNTYDFDPASDGSELYGTYNHVHLDLAKTEPGAEQKYVGYNWDSRNYGSPDRAGASQSIMRRVGPNKSLMMYTSGQGIVGDIKIFRYEGELAIPAGRIGGADVWIDANGDGKEDPGETSKMPMGIGWVTSLAVDSKGDIWAGNPSTGGSFMRHFFFKGLNAKGVPIYGATKGEGYEDIPFPEEGGKTNAWGMACRMDYDADRDIMVAFFPAVPRKGEGDKTPPQYFLACYENWSKGNRLSKWKVKAFTPQTDPDYFMYEVNVFPYSGYMGMQLAGDYIFMAYLFGEVHVFDLKTGKLVQILVNGPEVDGSSAWEDAAMGLRAFKTKAGEYLVLTENSGWGGKDNFFRWKP